MIPQLGLPELLIVAVVALIVVGPRDLPQLLRQVGGVMRRARSMASEFQRSFDEIGRESEMAELRREIQALRRGDMIQDTEEMRALNALERDVRDQAAGVAKDGMAKDGHAPAAPAETDEGARHAPAAKTEAGTPKQTSAAEPVSSSEAGDGRA